MKAVNSVALRVVLDGVLNDAVRAVRRGACHWHLTAWRWFHLRISHSTTERRWSWLAAKPRHAELLLKRPIHQRENGLWEVGLNVPRVGRDPAREVRLIHFPFVGHGVVTPGADED